jgi:septum formation protein
VPQFSRFVSPRKIAMTSPTLFLASQSPRRRELLEQMAVRYELVEVDVHEQALPGEPALDYVRRVAREKAGAGLMQVASIAQALVLGADTEVVLADRIFGKPADALEASAMLRALSGCRHKVLSAVALLSASREEEIVCITDVQFATLTEADISDYLATGEWRGKAGAYAIQGCAARFIERIEGSYSGVMGLPLFETAQLLRRFGC